jgi:Melibiase/Alpha galactosidase C-terminal beta sandwich domain
MIGSNILKTMMLPLLAAGGIFMITANGEAQDHKPVPTDVNIRVRGLSIVTHLTAETPSFDLLISGKPAVHASPGITGKITTAAASAAVDPDFGRGYSVELTSENGDIQTISLFEGLPFAVTHLVLHATGSVNKVPVLSASLPRITAGALSLGTGGLKPAADAVGSYAWAAVVNQHSREGIVCGFITHERGSGVVIPGAASVAARVEYGRLTVPAGEGVVTEQFAIGWFEDARIGMEAWADATAKRLHVKLPPMPVVYCTWYDNVHGGSSDQKALAELSAFASKELMPYGLGTIQIDDGWQMGEPHGNGPRKNFSAYDPHGPFPDGMKATAENIAGNGLRPGLWILPFGGSYNDPFFEKHPDWFVKTAEGKPFDTAWGGTALDMTNPGAIEFVSGEISQAVHDWGYHYLKLDGLSTGVGVHPQYVNDAYKEDNLGDGYFFNPNKPHIEVFRDGLKMIRGAAGPQTFILGCCAPQNMRSYAGVFGLVDGMRMGPDNGGSFRNWMVSADFGSRNYHLNGRIWWSDPDPMYVRESIPLASAECIASWNALSGQMISLSDWLPGLPKDRLEILRRCIPGHGVTARPVDMFETWPPAMWTVSDTRPGAVRRDVVGLFNWGHEEKQFKASFKSLGIAPAREYAIYDFWAKRLLPPAKAELSLTVPPEACRVLAVRPMLPHPFVISTSRHVSQGILELTGESWHPQTQTLQGTSALVAGDSYEVRIVARASAGTPAAEIAKEDRAAGVTVETVREGDLVLLRLHSSISKKVAWSVTFTK